ncbi:MAG: type II toxin-antitoxin system prevent-host-death family antitoxin [Dehalococcoidia bacterium]
METVGSYDAKTNLPRLLLRVAEGESVTITKHGVPIAMLVPYPGQPRRNTAKVIEEFIAYRNTLKPFRMNIREAINEGRP